MLLTKMISRRQVSLYFSGTSGCLQKGLVGFKEILTLFKLPGFTFAGVPKYIDFHGAEGILKFKET